MRVLALLLVAALSGAAGYLAHPAVGGSTELIPDPPAESGQAPAAEPAPPPIPPAAPPVAAEPGPPPRQVTEAKALFASTHRTPNFAVRAPSPEDAEAFGQLAERLRRELAVQWLGKELPPWADPCRLTVTLSGRGGGGATTFDFRDGKIGARVMQIEGGREELVADVLPHEVCHTILADYFRRPVPRWADEGAAVYAESPASLAKFHRMAVRQLNAGQGFKLKALFRMTEYPQAHLVLYAEGHSVARYLIDRKGRAEFLAFVRTGMAEGWDQAARRAGFKDVEDLEREWIEYLKRGGPAAAPPPRSGTSNYWWAVPASAAAAAAAIGWRPAGSGTTPGGRHV